VYVCEYVKFMNFQRSVWGGIVCEPGTKNKHGGGGVCETLAPSLLARLDLTRSTWRQIMSSWSAYFPTVKPD
jgi:hypothetical protein